MSAKVNSFTKSVKNVLPSGSDSDREGVSLGGALGISASYSYVTDTGSPFGEITFKQITVGISAGLPTSIPFSLSGSINETKQLWKSK